MKPEDIIHASKKRFDAQLHTEEYRHVHSDAEHLESLIGLFVGKNGKACLDIGTGNGYVAFELAERFPGMRFTGLDIAENSIAKNEQIKTKRNINNIEFVSYDGKAFPFGDRSFYGGISRYAFHHFPDAELTLNELRRTIEPGGFFILSDPVTHDEDTEGFADKFQGMLSDGHVHFYARKEIGDLFGRYGFRSEKEFYSSIRYPRTMSGDYEKLFSATDRKILDLYQIEMENEKVFIRVKVMNIFFRLENLHK